jgi:hypothetical protein
MLLYPRLLAARDDQLFDMFELLHDFPEAVVPPATCWPVVVVPWYAVPPAAVLVPP